MNENERMSEKSAQDVRTGGTGGEGGPILRIGGVLGQARDMANCSTSEGLRLRAARKAHESAAESVRHENLAKRLTPEIEMMLWCLQECLALGLLDGRVIADAAHARSDYDWIDSEAKQAP